MYFNTFVLLKDKNVNQQRKKRNHHLNKYLFQDNNLVTLLHFLPFYFPSFLFFSENPWKIHAGYVTMHPEIHLKGVCISPSLCVYYDDNQNFIKSFSYIQTFPISF